MVKGDVHLTKALSALRRWRALAHEQGMIGSPLMFRTKTFPFCDMAGLPKEYLFVTGI